MGKKIQVIIVEGLTCEETLCVQGEDGLNGHVNCVEAVVFKHHLAMYPLI